MLHIGQAVKSRGIALLLTLLFACISFSAEAQINPYARGRRSERTIIRSGQIYTPDSVEVRQIDSMRVAKLVDTLRKAIFGGLQRDSLAVDSLAKDTTLTERQRKRLERRENHTPFFSDSMSLRRVTLPSAVLPGFGQIYNKQYWKLPILYGTVGASLGLCLWSNSKFQPLKTEFDRLTDQSLLRTPELNAVHREMNKFSTMRNAFMITTIASYIYFIGDACLKYSTAEVSPVNRATTLAMICPGAGQIYN